jgi:hypothetical protein
MIEADAMPPWYYRPLHRTAQLSETERAQLVAWARAEHTALGAPPATP